MSKEEIMIIDLIKKNAKLIEEIEILKQEIENQKNIKAFWHIKNDIKKERIDKAIEYIEKYQIQNEYTDRTGMRVKENKWWLEDSDLLLEILRGKDE